MRQTNVRLTDKNEKTMEKEYYTCEFCQKEYVPNRRKLQKFCSSTCRTKNYYHKHATKSTDENADTKGAIGKVEEVSLAGVANAAVGVAAIEIAKNILTSEGNKPATKNDIREIKELIQKRYFLVHNLDDRFDGAKPYFDMATSMIIYLGKNELYKTVL